VLPTSNATANQNLCHWSMKNDVIGQPKLMSLANQDKFHISRNEINICRIHVVILGTRKI